MEELENKKEAAEVSESTEQVGESKVYYKEMSPAMMVMRRFFRSRLSMVGVIMLVALFVFSFAGPPVLHLFGYEWSETATDYTTTVKRATITLEGVETTDKEGNKYEIVQFKKRVFILFIITRPARWSVSRFIPNTKI